MLERLIESGNGLILDEKGQYDYYSGHSKFFLLEPP
jgi:hypothetical protein